MVQDEVLAFKDLSGRAPIHDPVISERHFTDLEEIGGLPEVVIRRAFEVASLVAEKPGVSKGGYAERVNDGSDSGQEVFCLHVMGSRKLGMA